MTTSARTSVQAQDMWSSRRIIDWRPSTRKPPPSTTRWPRSNGWPASYAQPIVLVGESAGGNLAACVAHHTRGHAHAPAGQVLIYPSLGADMTRGSYITHADAPMLTVSDLGFYLDIRTGGADVSGDPRYFPLADSDFSGLPPTAIFTAECDPLSSDGEFYRDRVTSGRRQGVVAGRTRPPPWLSSRPRNCGTGQRWFCAHRRRARGSRQNGAPYSP